MKINSFITDESKRKSQVKLENIITWRLMKTSDQNVCAVTRVLHKEKNRVFEIGS